MCSYGQMIQMGLKLEWCYKYSTYCSHCTSIIVGCASGFFLDGSMCAKCPNNSISGNFNDRVCTCKSGTTLEDGSSTTTSLPCLGMYGL